MTGRSHEKQDDQSQEAQRLEWEVRQAGEAGVAGEQAYERVEVAEGVELEQRQHAVAEAKHEGRDAEVAAIVEQRKEPGVEAAKRADAERDVQEQKCSCAEAADEQGLGSSVRMHNGADTDEEREIRCDAAEQDGVVEFLLPVPGNRPVACAHGWDSTRT